MKKKEYVGMVLSTFGLAGLIMGALLLYTQNADAFLWAIAITAVVVLMVVSAVYGLEMIFEEEA